MKKRVIILGSAGSIGRNALDVLRGLRDTFRVVGLATGTQREVLAEQAREFAPPAVAIGEERGTNARLVQGVGFPGADPDPLVDPSRAAASEGNGRSRLGAFDPSIRVFQGSDAAARLISEIECDIVLCAITGAASLAPTLKAVELGRRVAIANKEALVMAGAILMPLAWKSNADILPVDSEHSAIFQCLKAGRKEDVRRLILTASGGPFRGWTADRMAGITPEQALNHPTWRMGPKITVDSATMMNKALEIIEARWLFGVEVEKIEVWVHPESIVHSLVEYVDGSVVAQMGWPDMKTPIQYALTHPARLPLAQRPLDLSKLGAIHFESPDFERFPALHLGYEAAKLGGTAGAVLNAANEKAVDLFLRHEIGFLDIVDLTRRVLERHKVEGNPSLEAILQADRWARQEVHACLQRVIRPSRSS